LQTVSELSHWVTSKEQLLLGIAIISLLFFIASLALIPWILIRLPADYFSRSHERQPLLAARYNPLLSATVRILRNIIALIFIVLGLLMLVLPGQGLLTLFVGLVVAAFPGKRRLVNWLVSRPSICRPINWLRRRAGRQSLEMPE
jgi:hypothetical protein